jgi:hypothetical protein
MENKGHLDRTALPSTHQLTHMICSNEGVSSTSSESTATDWNNSKREAEFAVELLNPANKKCNVVRQPL